MTRNSTPSLLAPIDAFIDGGGIVRSNIQANTSVEELAQIEDSAIQESTIEQASVIKGTAATSSTLGGTINGIIQQIPIGVDTFAQVPSIFIRDSTVRADLVNQDAFGQLQVYVSQITGGTIGGSSTIRESQVSGGAITGSEIYDSNIGGGTILNSQISGMNIGSAIISNSTINGGTPRKGLGYGSVINKFCSDNNNDGVIAPFFNGVEIVQECN